MKQKKSRDTVGFTQLTFTLNGLLIIFVHRKVKCEGPPSSLNDPSMEAMMLSPLDMASAKSQRRASDHETAAADSDSTRKSTIPSIEEFFARFQEQAAKCLKNSYV